MKILFVGSLSEGQTSLMRMDVLRELGHDVSPLSTQVYWDNAPVLQRRLQQLAVAGSIVDRINEELLEAVRKAGPDLIWAEKQEYIKPEVVKEISALGVKFIHYTPDPYFSLSWKRTSLLDACLPLFDCLVTSKTYELDQYRSANPNVVYMPLGFFEKAHHPSFPKDESARELYRSDISFLGGWEPRRETYLDALKKEVDCSLKIWGYGWDHLKDGKWTLRRWWAMRRNAGGESFSIHRNDLLGNSLMGQGAYGKEYAWALSGARINIGFLRIICPDQHTTRSFEIPACKSLLLADRSDEHLAYFKEGEEADFFSDKEEMIDKVRFYLNNENIRERVATNGYKRCLTSGYSYKEIMSRTFNALVSKGII